MQSVRRVWSTGFQRSRAVQRDGRVHRSRAGADVAARGAPVAAQAAREGGEETGHDLLREKVGFTKKTARRHRRVRGRAVTVTAMLHRQRYRVIEKEKTR